MEFTAKVAKCEHYFLTLQTPNPVYLDKNVKYMVDIKPLKLTRSKDQNKYMWALISNISWITKTDLWDIYVSGLEKANVAYEYIACVPEAVENVRSMFRAVKLMGVEKVNGKDMATLKCFIGSSKFNTKQMTDLIDYFTVWLEQLEKGLDM